MQVELKLNIGSLYQFGFTAWCNTTLQIFLIVNDTINKSSRNKVRVLTLHDTFGYHSNGCTYIQSNKVEIIKLEFNNDIIFFKTYIVLYEDNTLF